MALTQVKVKLAPEGSLNIPFTITREAGFSPDEEATIVFTDDGFFVRREKKVRTADDVLQALLASGEIRLSDLGEHLGANLVPGITLEKIHEALVGVSVPIEEMIHEEREKYKGSPQPPKPSNTCPTCGATCDPCSVERCPSKYQVSF